MRLYLVRHPKPLVEPGICYGSTDLAVPAEEEARMAASLTAGLPQRAPIFSSPLRRCAGLAARLAQALDSRSVTHDARLAEMHFGGWEMRRWEDIPRAQIDAWADDVAAYRPGGGENVIEVARRVRAFHDQLRNDGIEDAVVVCHAGTIRLLLANRHGLSPAETALLAAQAEHRIGFGEVIAIAC